MPSSSVNSANFSGVHLRDKQYFDAPSSTVTANILPPTLKTRSLPHCTFSVTCGNERQYVRTCSISIDVFAAPPPDVRKGFAFSTWSKKNLRRLCLQRERGVTSIRDS